jgi:hypothetical protein
VGRRLSNSFLLTLYSFRRGFPPPGPMGMNGPMGMPMGMFPGPMGIPGPVGDLLSSRSLTDKFREWAHSCPVFVLVFPVLVAHSVR